MSDDPTRLDVVGVAALLGGCATCLLSGRPAGHRSIGHTSEPCASARLGELRSEHLGVFWAGSTSSQSWAGNRHEHVLRRNGVGNDQPRARILPALVLSAGVAVLAGILVGLTLGLVVAVALGLPVAYGICGLSGLLLLVGVSGRRPPRRITSPASVAVPRRPAPGRRRGLPAT